MKRFEYAQQGIRVNAICEIMWSAVGSPPLSVRCARLPLKLDWFAGASYSGGKPTALKMTTREKNG